jgi:hypothetical protein
LARGQYTAFCCDILILVYFNNHFTSWLKSTMEKLLRSYASEVLLSTENNGGKLKLLKCFLRSVAGVGTALRDQ